MARFYLRVRAPFAAFRWMQAGVFRATSPVIPPSAAWGLVLNLAGIETRGDDGITTQVRPDAPSLRIAVGRHGEGLGEDEPVETAVLYQQLHSYRVDLDDKAEALASMAHGSKYWIAPARRELLVGMDVVIGVEADDTGLASSVNDGLEGRLAAPRYGLPFAGDNNCLIDRIELLDAPPVSRWYGRVSGAEGPRPGSCRLTIGIDRADSSRTTSGLFAPMPASSEPDDSAWVWTPRRP